MPRDSDHTLILVKPDGVHRKLVGRILARFEDADLAIIALDLTYPDQQLVARHYHEHRHKDFYDNLVTYLTDRPVVAAILAGDNAVPTARNVSGDTDPLTRTPVPFVVTSVRTAWLKPTRRTVHCGTLSTPATVGRPRCERSNCGSPTTISNRYLQPSRYSMRCFAVSDWNATVPCS